MLPCLSSSFSVNGNALGRSWFLMQISSSTISLILMNFGNSNHPCCWRINSKYHVRSKLRPLRLIRDCGLVKRGELGKIFYRLHLPNFRSRNGLLRRQIQHVGVRVGITVRTESTGISHSQRKQTQPFSQIDSRSHSTISRRR